MTDLLHPTAINAQLGIDMLPVVANPATEHPNAANASKAYCPANGNWWTKKSSGWVQDGSASGGSADWTNITNTPTTIAGYNITDAFTQALADARYLKLAGGAISGSVSVTGRVQSSRVLIESTDYNPWNGDFSDGVDAVIAAVSGSTTGGSVSQSGSSLVLQAGIGTGGGANGDIIFRGASSTVNQGGNARHSAPTVYGRITMGGAFTIGSIVASGQASAGSFYTTGALTAASATIGGYAIMRVRESLMSSGTPSDMVQGEVWFGTTLS